LDIYTQAVTPAKQAAQAAVVSPVFSAEEIEVLADQTSN